MDCRTDYVNYKLWEIIMRKIVIDVDNGIGFTNWVIWDNIRGLNYEIDF